MPESLGSPRSMIARSNGTSRPMYRPSSPSAAMSTAKPSRLSRAARVSRRGASSSTSMIRIGLLLRVEFAPCCRHQYHLHQPVLRQDLDAIHLLLAYTHGLGGKDAPARFPLHPFDCIAQVE